MVSIPETKSTASCPSLVTEVIFRFIINTGIFFEEFDFRASGSKLSPEKSELVEKYVNEESLEDWVDVLDEEGEAGGVVTANLALFAIGVTGGGFTN